MVPVKTEAAALTYGWDTVFAIPAPDVNRAIVQAKSSPKGFSMPAGGGAPATSATFSDWQITRDGDGKNLRMVVPAHDVTLGEAKYANVEARIEIKLEALPHTDVPPPAAGKLMKLVPRTTSPDPQTDPVVIVEQNVTSEPPMGIFEKALYLAQLGEWLNANLGEFNHIFAVVNINEDIDRNAQWAFTTPSYIEYAFLARDTLETSTFAVLCMTGGRSGAGLTAQLSPNAIPPGDHGGFLISGRRYLNDLLKPALCLCYQGLKTDDVRVASDASAVELAPGRTVKLQDIHHDGRSYTPHLTELNIEIIDATMRVTSQTHVAISPGIVAYTKAVHWYNVVLKSRADGSQSLEYVESQPADVQHWVEKDPKVVITEIIVSIMAALSIAVLAVLTDGAALAVGAVIIGALGGLAAATPKIISVVNSDAAPAIDALRINATSPIRWPDSNTFTLSMARLNGSLQLGGNPHFVT